MSPSINVDRTSCSRCGVCVAECPTAAMRLTDTDVPTVDYERCLDCGHCGAVCAAGAIRSDVGDFPLWSSPKISPADAKAFLSGRRSTRRYHPVSLEQETIAEVLSIGPFAPTASNAQDVSATVFTDDRVFELATRVNDYYRWFDGLLKRRILWPLLWFTDARAYLKNPEKLAGIRQKVEHFDREHDWLFFSAPAVVLLSAPRRHQLFGRVNCVIAAERMMHYAAALGLGSCLIGYAEMAMKRRPSIARAMGIAADLQPQVLFTLGLPKVQYRRLPARRPIPVRWVASLTEPQFSEPSED